MPTHLMPAPAHRRLLIGPLLAISLVAASLLALGSATHSTAALDATKPVPALGAQWHATWGSLTDADRARELDVMAANGVEWVRIDVGWASLQPKPGSYDTAWAVPFVQKQIEDAKAKGFKVLVTFWRTPAWANGGRGPLVAPTDPQTFGAALGHFVKLWKGKVDAWEIWNEPNSGDFLVGADPVEYTGLLRAGYRAAKAADPESTIVYGGPMYVDTDWIRRTYDAGAQGHFDVMAVHPYMAPGDAPPEKPDDGTQWNMMHTDALVTMMKNRGDGSKPIWFTELGWSTHPNTSSTPNWQRGVTEAQQADYFRRSVELTQSRWPQVDVMIWYNSRDKSTGDFHQDGYGLMRRDFSPKPVLPLFAKLRAGGTVPPTSPTPTPTPTPTTPTEPTSPTRQTLVAAGTTWRFSDSGRRHRGWRLPGFDHGRWKAGNAVLGYGDSDVSTVTAPSRTTYAFRKVFRLDNPYRTSSLRLRVQRDDGIAVYVNGKRAWVDNLPSDFRWHSPASTSIYENESAWLTATVPSRLLERGRNVVAVEVHNAAASSSDIKFNLSLDRALG